MTTTTKRLSLRLASLALVCGLAGSALAEESESTTYMVETDPATFALGGYAAHLRISHHTHPGIVVGLGTYRLDLPEFLLELDSDNEGENWQATITGGYGLFVDYHFSGKPEGLFVGGQLALQRFSVSRTGFEDTSDFANILAMARVGTLWKPTSTGLYIMPWLGLGATARVSGDSPVVGGEEFAQMPVTAFATLHVGWQF